MQERAQQVRVYKLGQNTNWNLNLHMNLNINCKKIVEYYINLLQFVFKSGFLLCTVNLIF